MPSCATLPLALKEAMMASAAKPLDSQGVSLGLACPQTKGRIEHSGTSQHRANQIEYSFV
eukprot:3916801-Prorocentrum_lima.AAC.1